jgi:predicted dehydrogenase
MKIGIMSFAHHHADAYIQNLRLLPGVEILGVADIDAVRGQSYARGSGSRYFPSYADLLEAKPDGVIICSENNQHRRLVEMAAACRVHVLCEKPIATTIEDARLEVAACERAGVLFMTAFPMRFSPALLEIKSRLEAGDFGSVYCFNTTNQGELPTKHRQWFADPVLAGGGAIADHTVHLVDIMRWFMQDEIATVYAQSNRIFHANEVEVETGALEMITFKRGGFASIDSSWSRPPYWPTWGGLTIEMVTERGAVIVDAFRQNLTVYSHALQRPTWSYWGSDMNQAMIAEFVAAIRENRPPCVTGIDGLRAVEAVVAAYESTGIGQPVAL